MEDERNARIQKLPVYQGVVYLENVGFVSTITDKLYLSDWTWTCACNKAILEQYQIKTIICINEAKKTEKDLAVYEQLGIQHYQINMEDHYGENFAGQFDTLDTYFDYAEKTGNLLIHCTAGVSRSVTAVLYYCIIFVPGKT